MFTIDEWETTNKTVHEPQYSPVESKKDDKSGQNL